MNYGAHQMDGMSAPAHDAWAVTPGSSALARPARALWIGTTGDVEVITAGGTTVIFTNVPVGFLAVRCTHVLSANTTATGIVAIV